MFKNFSPKVLAALSPLGFSLAITSLSTQAIPDSATTQTSQYPSIEGKLYHSDGVVNEYDLCPKSPFDTIAPVTQLNPEPKPNTPEMTITGIYDFIKKNKITTIDDLLKHFPDHYRNNFSLVEHTRATGQSNLEFPRIVMFGSDGHFLLNVGTKPDDPLYNALDVAELDTQTGQWEFSVFDFSKEKPSLTRNDESCNECHGSTNSRPIWGDFQQWTGVFGDSLVEGPRPEALDDTHAEKMNDLMFGSSNPPRFDTLLWKQQPLHRGGFREIANHDFGPELLLSNIAMGSATAKGAFIRLSKQQPKQYKAMRKSLLLAYFQKRVEKRRYFIKVNHSKELLDYAYGMEQRIKGRLNSNTKDVNVPNQSLDQQLAELGLDTKEAFSLNTLHETETPNTEWGMAAADLYDLLMLQILDDIRKDDPAIDKILQETKPEYGIFQCDNTAKNIADLIDFKMLHLFQLQGEARYQADWLFYAKDVEDVYDQVFLPIAMPLMDYLLADKK